MKRERSFISNFKLFIEVVIFIAVFMIAYGIIEKSYADAASKNVINAYTKSRYDEFYAQPENTIDMVFLGSSHSYCTFDPENFDSRLNSNSWQMGTPLQHYDTTLYSLKEVLKTQKPKVVVMELYWDMLDDKFDMKQANSFFEVVSEEVKRDYIKNVFPINEKVKYKLMPIRYQQDYFAYESNEIDKALQEKIGVTPKKADETNGEEYYLSKGYVYCDTVIPSSELDETNQYKGLDGKTWEPNEIQLGYVKDIVDLCKQNEIEIVFVTAPIATVSMDFIDNYDYIHNKLEDIASGLGVKYVDFNLINKELSILALENFRDDAHLNDSGVKIVNAYYADWLVNNTVTFGNN